ncbi:hypothetical protein ACFQ3Z_01655 [Streptomyces nogalater]
MARRTLPAFLVPAVVLTLPEIPLTPNGKVDRKALPEPEAPAPGRAPRTETERILRDLGAELIGRPELGADDNLFIMGMDSIHALRLASPGPAPPVSGSPRRTCSPTPPSKPSRTWPGPPPPPAPPGPGPSPPPAAAPG